MRIVVANQKGKYLAKKLNKIVKDQDSPKPFEFHNSGSLAYIGNWFVHFLNAPQVPMLMSMFVQESCIWQVISGEHEDEGIGSSSVAVMAISVFHYDTQS